MVPLYTLFSWSDSFAVFKLKCSMVWMYLAHICPEIPRDKISPYLHVSSVHHFGMLYSPLIFAFDVPPVLGILRFTNALNCMWCVKSKSNISNRSRWLSVADWGNYVVNRWRCLLAKKHDTFSLCAIKELNIYTLLKKKNRKHFSYPKN